MDAARLRAVDDPGSLRYDDDTAQVIADLLQAEGSNCYCDAHGHECARGLYWVGRLRSAGWDWKAARHLEALSLLGTIQ